MLVREKPNVFTDFWSAMFEYYAVVLQIDNKGRMK